MKKKAPRWNEPSAPCAVVPLETPAVPCSKRRQSLNNTVQQSAGFGVVRTYTIAALASHLRCELLARTRSRPNSVIAQCSFSANFLLLSYFQPNERSLTEARSSIGGYPHVATGTTCQEMTATKLLGMNAVLEALWKAKQNYSDTRFIRC
jgi:hypothetical protein